MVYFAEKREERTRAKRNGEKACRWNRQRGRIVESIGIAFDL